MAWISRVNTYFAKFGMIKTGVPATYIWERGTCGWFLTTSSATSSTVDAVATDSIAPTPTSSSVDVDSVIEGNGGEAGGLEAS